MNTSDVFENRFRDPAFVAIWQRWQDARNMWEKEWWFVLMGEGGKSVVYDPDPTLISNPKRSAQAKEFQDARTAYKAEVQHRLSEPDASCVSEA